MDEKLSFYGLFCGPQICQKIHWRPGLRPGPRWGSSRCSPSPPSWLGRGTAPPHPPPPRCLRRLDSRAFGASILVTPRGSLVPPAALELATVLGKSVIPDQPFFLSQSMHLPVMWYKNFGRSFFRFVTIHAFDRRSAWSKKHRGCIAAERSRSIPKSILSFDPTLTSAIFSVLFLLVSDVYFCCTLCLFVVIYVSGILLYAFTLHCLIYC